MEPLCCQLGILELPREVRDLIHEYVLVRDVIPITCAITKSSSSRDVDADNDVSSQYPLHTPRLHRRLWLVPAFDLDLDSTADDRHKPSTISMTYQYANCSRSSIDKPGSVEKGLDIHWMQACRQIYEEAIEIFYGHNTFSFTSDFRIPTAFAFLCDRPAVSLRYIKSLELALMEDTNMRGTQQAHYPPIRRATDSLVLQYSYQYFTELCTLLSTPRIRLRKLYLSVETMYTPGVVGQDSLVDSIKQEKNDLRGQNPAPLWLDPLLNIEALELVELHWTFRLPRVLRMSQTAALVRQHMLDQTRNNNSSDASTTGEPEGPRLEFRALHLAEDGPDVFWDGTKKWSYFTLQGDVFQLLRIEEEGEVSTGFPPLPQHLKWLFQLYMDVWLFHCTLRCA
ncbi:hypothetical protein IQ06DRAFT_222514 [Phaeosphaeriaceae sp. SRC1lsM3a]|nr:hypothetical protein IQ06DRAFT_222514 [Stagonospora sp. SRC1lsM3a]